MKEIIDLDIPAAKPAPVSGTLTEKKKKDLLIQNYLTNLSSYQEVVLKVSKEGEEDKHVTLSPNVNFTAEKHYYIFYNNNLKKLIDLYKEELKKQLSNHNVILYHKKDNLNNCLKELGFNPLPDIDSGPFKYFSKLIARKWYQNEIDRVNLLANNLSILTNVVKEFSDKISEEKLCSIKISENTFDEIIKVKKYDIKNNENIDSLKCIREIEEIKTKNIDDKEKLKLMNKKINEFKKRIIPENSINNLIDFCLVLNYISEYVDNFERSLETKEYPFLKTMDTIRRKLDHYLLEFRYKFIKNQSPILNIKIHRYKMICDSLEKRTIYLERGETKKFMKDLFEEIDKKAKNIDANYQFQDIELKDIIQIAKEINFNELDDLIRNIDEKIIECKSQYRAKKIELVSSSAKDIIKFSVNTINGLCLKMNGINTIIKPEQIMNFLKKDENIIKTEKETEKENKNKTEKEENKDSEDNIKKEKETETENKDSKEKEENKDSKEITKEINDKIVEKRKENMNNIGIETKGMSEEIINKVSKSLYLYHDMEKMIYNIKRYTIMRKKITEKSDYNYDFYNALKLYCYMLKKELDNNDYTGIILEEKNKEKSSDLREYSLNKLTEIQND